MYTWEECAGNQKNYKQTNNQTNKQTTKQNNKTNKNILLKFKI
jgi:hypothetical protein